MSPAFTRSRTALLKRSESPDERLANLADVLGLIDGIADDTEEKLVLRGFTKANHLLLLGDDDLRDIFPLWSMLQQKQLSTIIVYLSMRLPITSSMTIDDIACEVQKRREQSQDRAQHDDIRTDAPRLTLPDFGGRTHMWLQWKAMVMSTLGQSAYLLDTAALDPKQSRLLFHSLEASTQGGAANDIVNKSRDTQDGKQAWRDLIDWYERDAAAQSPANNRVTFTMTGNATFPSTMERRIAKQKRSRVLMRYLYAGDTINAAKTQAEYLIYRSTEQGERTNNVFDNLEEKGFFCLQRILPNAVVSALRAEVKSLTNAQGFVSMDTCHDQVQMHPLQPVGDNGNVIGNENYQKELPWLNGMLGGWLQYLWPHHTYKNASLLRTTWRKANWNPCNGHYHYSIKQMHDIVRIGRERKRPFSIIIPLEKDIFLDIGHMKGQVGCPRKLKPQKIKLGDVFVLNWNMFHRTSEPTMAARVLRRSSRTQTKKNVSQLTRRKPTDLRLHIAAVTTERLVHSELLGV